MATGDPHTLGRCWCGRSHERGGWRDGYDALAAAAARVEALPDHGQPFADGTWDSMYEWGRLDGLREALAAIRADSPAEKGAKA